MSHSAPAGEDPPESASETCPECDGEVQASDRQRVCADCGLVVSTTNIVQDLERSEAFRDPEDGPSRTSGPTSLAHHDGKLGGEMSDPDADSTVSAQKRRRLARQQRVDSGKKFSSKAERNLAQALSEISRMTTALGLPDAVRQRAYVICRESQSADLFRGRSIEAAAGGALYAAAREQGVVRPLETIGEVSRVDSNRVRSMYDAMNLELDIEPMLIDPSDWIPQFADDLGLDTDTTREALRLARVAEAHPERFSGKSPSGIAAACLYLATDRRMTQKQVAEVVDVVPPTIRNRVEDFEAIDEA